MSSYIPPQKKWMPTCVSIKQTLLPTVRIEYYDMKKEREIIKQKVIEEYKRKYGQAMRIYNVEKRVKGEVYVRVEVGLYGGSISKRYESVRIYLSESIPEEIVESMRVEDMRIRVSDRVVLEKREGIVRYVRSGS